MTSSPLAIAEAGTTHDLRQGIVLFVVTALTLLVVLVGVLLLVLARRRSREGRSDSTTSTPLPDAWAESGRRVEPFSSPQPPAEPGEEDWDEDG